MFVALGPSMGCFASNLSFPRYIPLSVFEYKSVCVCMCVCVQIPSQSASQCAHVCYDKIVILWSC